MGIMGVDKREEKGLAGVRFWTTFYALSLIGVAMDVFDKDSSN
jgi:hypothetical protein